MTRTTAILNSVHTRSAPPCAGYPRRNLWVCNGINRDLPGLRSLEVENLYSKGKAWLDGFEKLGEVLQSPTAKYKLPTSFPDKTNKDLVDWGSLFIPILNKLSH